MGRHALPSKGPVDRLSPFFRHLVIAAAPFVLDYTARVLVPALREQYGATVLGSVAIAALVGWLTPLTRQYGVGAPPAQSSDDPH